MRDPEYYVPSFRYYSHVVYSFLTLASKPDADYPPLEEWNGQAIYETMTLAPVLTVMKDTSYTYNWMADRIKAMIQATKAANKKFIWGIGGWSDLQYTIRKDQIDNFVQQCVDLVK